MPAYDIISPNGDRLVVSGTRLSVAACGSVSIEKCVGSCGGATWVTVAVVPADWCVVKQK